MPTAATPLHALGIDLAWGSRARSGLAALDDDGRLLDLADASTDDEISAWVGRWGSGRCIVGIDAPIVVLNATGARECERLVTRYFGRHHAGAHPANTGNPAFAGGRSRALRLTERLGLDVDPESSAPRRALEVFPHPATVALFGLPRVLRYKHKPGRDLALLQAEMTSLLRHIEDLDSAEPPLRVTGHAGWRAVCRAVDTATRKVDLRRVEDRVDAVVCAYVALLAARDPSRVHVFGDVHSGYIATPVTPEVASRVVVDRRAAESESAPPVRSSAGARDRGAALGG